LRVSAFAVCAHDGRFEVARHKGYYLDPDKSQSRFPRGGHGGREASLCVETAMMWVEAFLAWTVLSIFAAPLIGRFLARL
jgi:hypothetical protein